MLSLLILVSYQGIKAQPEEIYLQIPAAADTYVAEDKSAWKAGLEDYLIIGYSEYLSQHDCYIDGWAPGYYQKWIVCTQEYRVGDQRNILVHFNLDEIPRDLRSRRRYFSFMSTPPETICLSSFTD